MSAAAGLTRLLATLRRPLVRSSAGLGALTVSDMALGLAAAVLLARDLGAEGLGFYALAMAVATLAGLPVEFGLPGLVMREVAHAGAGPGAPMMKGVIGFAVMVIGALSLVVVPAVLVLAASPLGVLDPSVSAILPVAVLLIPVSALGKVLGAAQAGRERVVLGALPQRLVRPGAFALALAGAAMLAPGWLTPARAVGLHLGASAVALALGVTLFLFQFRAILRQPGLSVPWRQWLPAMLRLGLAGGMMQANPQILLLLTGALSSVENVGLLRIAQRGAGLVATAAAIALVPAAPRIARLHAEGAQPEVQRLITLVARTTLTITLLGLATFALGRDWILATVFGAEFAAAGTALMVLCTAEAVRASFGPGETVVSVLRHERETMRAFAAAVTISAGIAALLLPTFAAAGAAAGMLAGDAAKAVYLRARARRLLGLDPAAFRR